MSETVTVNFEVPVKWKIARINMLETWKHLLKIGIIERKRQLDRELYLSLDRPVKKLSQTCV